MPLITLPTATSTLNSVAGYSAPLFDVVLPIGLLVIGFLIGGAIVGYVLGAVVKGVYKVTGGGRKGRRGRRR